jgi:integrase
MSRLIDWNLEPEIWLIEQNSKAKQLLQNPLLKKDLWRTVEDLKLEVNQHNKGLTIRFQGIEQDWLRLLAKLYILVKSQRKLSCLHLKDNIYSLKKFSHFLHQKSILVPEQINNQCFEDYEQYLLLSKLSPKTITNYLSSLKDFLNICNQEGWLDINTYWFAGKAKNITPKNENIEYIPEEVWQQLDKYLHHLPEQIQRMVLLIRATGLRIGELANLPLDCLRERDKKWRLRFLSEKYNIEDEIFICEELVVVVKEQQEYIQQQFSGSYHYLFTGNNGRGYHPVSKIMNIRTLNSWLNKLAINHNICTKDGKVWHFTSHQFRRTVATVMDNAGVRALIVQKYLRHRSPDMQNHYKHLLEKVLGQEYQELMKETKYVNSTGKLVAIHKPKNPITEIVRRKMYQITTQYGECHRPQLKSPCQTVNACWRCEHWRTSIDDLDYLKKDLERLNTEIYVARQLEMIRQEKGLINDQQSLEIRIRGLEEINNEN